MNRETIYAALFAKVSAAAAFKTTSRRLKHWDNVAAGDHPALFQVQKGEMPEQRRGLPPKWHLDADLYVYARSGADPAIAPAIELNALIDAIETALAPSPVTGFQTLDGLVSHCWISGRIETDEGVLGDQAIAIIPIEILIA